MDYQMLDICVFVVFFCLIFLGVYYFMGPIEDATGEFRARQRELGATTFSDLYINLSPETFLVLRLSLAAVLFFAISAIHLVPALVAAAAGWLGPAMYLKRLKDKRVKVVEAQLVEGLELMGNALKSGLTLPQAVELLVKEFPPPIKQEFNLVLAENRLGIDLTDAMHNMANRLNSTIVSILVTGIAITKRCGGDLTEIFQNIATTIREQATIEGKLDAVTAQGRFQGLILSVMPFALVVILWFVDRQHVETLFGYQLGIWAFLGVVGMVLMAQLWIRQLLIIDV